MRVAFIAEHYPPTAGGVATSAQRVARSLARLGVDVEVFCFDDASPVTSATYIRAETDDLVKVKRVGPFFLKQPREVMALLDEKVRAVLRRQVVNAIVQDLSPHPPDVVLSFYVLNAGFIAQFIGAALGIPVVAGVRGNDIGRNIFHVERFAATQWVIQRAAAIVCVNEHLRQRLLWAWPDAAPRVSVIPNSVVVPPEPAPGNSHRLSIRDRLSWSSTAFVLVFIGTMREKKGVTILVTAMTALADDNIRLLIIGPDIGPLERKLCGAEWDELQRTGRLFVTGAMARDDVGQWMIGADAVVMPSIDDGMANGLLEGMARGLCPIVSDVFQDVVTQGVNGIVVRRGDPTALAEGIRRAASNPHAARMLGVQARSHVAGRTPDMEASDYFQLLTSIGRGESTNAE